MDLKEYFRKIREQAELIPTEEVVVVSKATSDGGKEGTFSEVSRRIAAQLLIDGRARLATAEESQNFAAEMEERRRRVQEQTLSQRFQVAVISESEMQAFKSSKRVSKP
jgi:hypothetical protein